MNLVKLESYMSEFTKYPVSELFGSIDSPNAKQKKAEKRCADICEELYHLSVNKLSNVRSAYRELDVIHKLCTDVKCKDTYFAKVSGSLAYYVDVAVLALEVMHKKDQVLQEYYKPWATKSKELKEEIKHNMFLYYPDIQKNELVQMFEEGYLETKKKEEAK